MARPVASDVLTDLTVLDLTHVRSGPTCVRQLADWGANVIKIEKRDATAKEPADFSARHDPDFQNLHRNKRSIALDLKTREGLEIFLRMTEQADIVVENYRPDVKKRLGIDYDTLAKRNPRLIYASISGFGEDGPYKDRPGVDQVVQGMSGLMSITGEPGRGPVRVGTAISDLSAGVFAALGILLALYERVRSGKGQWVQTSLLHAQIFMLDFQAARYVMSGEVPNQAGNNHPTGVPSGTYRTRDGYININPTPPMWRRFCKAINREDMIEDSDYRTAQARRNNRDKLNMLIEAISSTFDTSDLADQLNKAGIPAGPIYNMDEAFKDPQVRHLGIAQTVNSAALGPIQILGQPIKLSRTPTRMVLAAPEYGEHTEEVLAEFGYSELQIRELRKSGVA